MTIKYLTVESVLHLHEAILKDTKEDKGLAPHTSITSALHRIDDHITYDGLDDVHEIAALYGIAIAKGHCFNNGNKRTALVSMLTFLLLNDIDIDVSNNLIEEIMVEIATNQIDKTQLTNFFIHSLQIHSEHPEIYSAFFSMSLKFSLQSLHRLLIRYYPFLFYFFSLLSAICSNAIVFIQSITLSLVRLGMPYN